ncbi:MAG: hypothetical protein A2X94_10495 [Bdellovibrionales bacterium GWB1_55_8]|nr:MAG: hypothetical protein A2X94_10495 [Bdellovibrionales bacterium GWB1_55_8]
MDAPEKSKGKRGIVLTTINARYVHPSLGLRYLFAQLGALQDQCTLIEFASKTPNALIAESLKNHDPVILGISVSIWNITQILEVLPVLRSELPNTRIVLGGPEVSHHPERHPAFPLVDHVVCGEADLEFPKLCRAIMNGETSPKIISCTPCDLSELNSPYSFYSDQDLLEKFTYVEASRGCPFGCEFCLSSLDVPVRRFELGRFQQEIGTLFGRGARRFKFIDRTFNLSAAFSAELLAFLLPFAEQGAFFHFEIVPDRLAPELMRIAARYPGGTLQFEVGIQTFNPVVCERIGRRQDFDATEKNLRWLKENSSVHLHSDLIVGLPGENIESFATGFNRLHAIGPQEIQVGMLKRLHGAPISRHDEAWAMSYSGAAPYEVLSTSHMDEATVKRLKQFARIVDLFFNRGQFPALIRLLVRENAFHDLMSFTDWLVLSKGTLHALSLEEQFGLISRYLREKLDQPLEQIISALEADYHLNAGRKAGPFRRLIERLQ